MVDDPPPSDNLFVTGLPADLDVEGVQEIFQWYGTVTQCKLLPGQGKNAALIRFESLEQASDVVLAVDGSVPEGLTSPLTVRFAKQSGGRRVQPLSSQHGGKGATGKGGWEGKGSGKMQAEPGATVFIFHMPNTWDEDDLQRHFQHCGGIVQTKVWRDLDGKSKGFGFLSFDSLQGALKARTGMDHFSAGGKFLSVKTKQGEEAFELPLPIYPQRGRLEVPISAGLRAPHEATICVYHLPPTWSEEELTSHFIHMGAIVHVNVMAKPGTAENKGIGFVGFEHPASAQRAIAGMHGFMVGERKFLDVSLKQGAGKPASIQAPSMNAAAENAVALVYTSAIRAVRTQLKVAFGDVSALPDDWTAHIEQGARLAVEHALELQAAESIQAKAPVGLWNVKAPHRSAAAIAYRGAVPGAQTATPADRSFLQVPPGANLYIFHVPNTWAEADLMEIFGDYGNVISAQVARDDSGRSRGYAFVGYDDAASAAAAIEGLHGLRTPEGKVLQVSLKERRGAGGGKPY